MVDGKREPFCTLKPLAECRAVWVEACGWTGYEWDDVDGRPWVCRSGVGV